MNVFKIERRAPSYGEPRHSLAIDPGIKTIGWCLYDKENGTFSHGFKEFEEESPLSVDFPRLYEMVHRVLVNLSGELKGVDFMFTEVVVEYPHIGGQFSTGLCCYLTRLIDTLVMRHNCPRISLIPNRIPEWFLKKRSVSGTETVQLVKKVLDIQGRIKVHAADAILFSIFRHFDLWLKFNGKGIAEMRRPEFTEINLNL